MAVLAAMVNELSPSGYMRYSPDGHFVFATFASAFLIKLLRPEFSAFLTGEQRNQIFDHIEALIAAWKAPEIAIDLRHTPHLHAKFLAGLLSKYRRDLSTAGRQQHRHDPSHQEDTTIGQGPSGSHATQPGYDSSIQHQHVFSVSPQQGGSQGQQDMSHSYTLSQSSAPSHSNVHPVLEYDPAPNGFDAFGSDVTAAGFEDDLMGALQVFKNPSYWQNMMMPGFSWPDTRMSDPAYQEAIPAFHNAFHVQPVPTAHY